MMSVFTRRVACDSDRIVECTLMLAMNVNGIGVAVSRCVTRIRSSSRETERTGGGSLVLLTAGPIRQRAATADAPRGAHSRLALGVGSPTLPPSCPPSFRTMDGFASRRNCSSSPAPRLAPIVIRKAADCSGEKREGKRCPQRALYGIRGRSHSSSSSLAAGLRGRRRSHLSPRPRKS
jgi:hypothetical protein